MSTIKNRMQLVLAFLISQLIFLFSTKGRISRKELHFHLFRVSFFWVLPVIFIGASIIPIEPTSYNSPILYRLMGFSANVIFCLAVWPLISLFIKRGHDRNKKFAKSFIILGIWFFLGTIYTVFLPSSILNICKYTNAGWCETANFTLSLLAFFLGLLLFIRIMYIVIICSIKGSASGAERFSPAPVMLDELNEPPIWMKED